MFVKRKGTKEARILPINFDELRTEFLCSVSKIIREINIPKELVMNFNQNISRLFHEKIGQWRKKEINITPSSTDSSLDFILDVNFDSSTVKIADPDDINFIDQFLEDIETNYNNCAGKSELVINYGDDKMPNLPKEVCWKGHTQPCEPCTHKIKEDTLCHIKAAIYVCRYISKQQHCSEPVYL
ncbi:unnamed protein product [Mytilus edulis]|uniref:Uncharacterized protein n=1 Tax=Mytilus edulis TaxID=6550 RepID=A0A8S3V8T5_MYTED|nr:unnamed protein product [Mytilus edulis]